MVYAFWFCNVWCNHYALSNGFSPCLAYLLFLNGLVTLPYALACILVSSFIAIHARVTAAADNTVQPSVLPSALTFGCTRNWILNRNEGVNHF